MKFNRQSIGVKEAQNQIEAYIQAGQHESVALVESFGRRLAEQVSANHSIPHFRRSGMDGFAIRSIDTIEASYGQSIELEVIETIPCGTMPTHKVNKGQAARIMTGSAVPEGADAVVMFEWTEEQERGGTPFVSLKRKMNVGDNISPVGSEVIEGTVLLEKGSLIGAGEAAILATMGYSSVKVYKKPKVAIISTGSELLKIEDAIQPGKIRNSNSMMVAALVQEAGGETLFLDQLADHMTQLKATLVEAFSKADIVITTGGVSVGDYDILSDLFDDWEGSMLFNKVEMRPGSPTTVGVWSNKLLFSLSGNPGACFVGFELFVRPVLWGSQGRKSLYHSEFTAYLAVNYAKPAPFTRYVRGLSYLENGKAYVEPVGLNKSSTMISIKDADCLIIIPPGGKGAQHGDKVIAMRLKEE